MADATNSIFTRCIRFAATCTEMLSNAETTSRKFENAVARYSFSDILVYLCSIAYLLYKKDTCEF